MKPTKKDLIHADQELENAIRKHHNEGDDNLLSDMLSESAALKKAIEEFEEEDED